MLESSPNIAVKIISVEIAKIVTKTYCFCSLIFLGM